MRHGFPIVALLTLASLGCAGAKEFTYLETSPVRITELHFDPSPAQGQAEFIEITNVSAKIVDLSGWQVTGAGRVALAAGTRLGPREVLILCQDPAAFQQAFAGAVAPGGTLSGKLRNAGETVRIEDTEGKVAEEASYDELDPEVKKAAGTGDSLHRRSAPGEAGGGAAWKAGKPTPGKP
jgi:hypothetical protein